MIGIYKITNMLNGKSYIGQSRKLEKRWQKHKTAYRNVKDKGYNYPLYQSFRKHGIENFSFEIVEECLITELNEKERFYIGHFDTFFHGYNQTLGGDTSSQITKERVIGIINDLTTSNLLHREIAERWNVSTEMVQGINTGRYWKHDRSYPIQPQSIIHRYRGKNQKQINHCINCGRVIDSHATRCVKCALIYRAEKRLEKAQLIAELKSSKSICAIAKKYNVSDNTIRKWCKHYNLSTQIADYKVSIDPNNGTTP